MNEKQVAVGRVVVGSAGAYFTAAAASAIVDPMLASGLGAASGYVASVLIDIGARLLSKKEAERMDRAANAAIEMILDYRKQGRQLRQDNFFTPSLDDRADAETVFEGVLLTARTSFEEKKVPFIGYIFANLAFRPEVRPDTANYILNYAERLTYHQLCLASLARQSVKFRADGSWAGRSKRRGTYELLSHELRDLSEIIHGSGNSEIPPELTPLGTLFYELMSLDRIPAEDLLQVATEVNK